jgi:hypothetical protein
MIFHFLFLALYRRERAEFVNERSEFTNSGEGSVKKVLFTLYHRERVIFHNERKRI